MVLNSVVRCVYVRFCNTLMIRYAQRHDAAEVYMYVNIAKEDITTLY
jgi:hypothetical protein